MPFSVYTKAFSALHICSSLCAMPGLKFSNAAPNCSAMNYNAWPTLLKRRSSYGEEPVRGCLPAIASSSRKTCLISLHWCHRRPKNLKPLRLDHGNTLHLCLDCYRSCSPWPSFLTNIPDRPSTQCLYRNVTFLRFRPLRQSMYHPDHHPRDYRIEVKMVEEREELHLLISMDP